MSLSFNTISKMNDSLITFLEKPIIKYGFLIIIIIQIINIKNLSTSYIQIFNNMYFKVIYAFLIAYYACFDPVYSIALTTLIIISIQELHTRNATSNIISLLPQKHKNDIKINSIPLSNSKLNSKSNSTPKLFNSININSGKMTAKIFDNDELVYELINKHSLQKQPDINDKLTGEYEFCQEPAYQTITNNLKNIDNNITNANQNSSIQGLNGDIFNIQGLPNGYESK